MLYVNIFEVFLYFFKKELLQCVAVEDLVEGAAVAVVGAAVVEAEAVAVEGEVEAAAGQQEQRKQP